MKKTHFSTGEVAKFCGVTLRTVINWIKAGRLAAFQLPGTRGDNRITKDELIRFINANQIPMPLALSESESRKPAALIVDDEPSFARAIERILRRAGYETFIALDGFEAGRLFVAHKPRLFTLDLQMPHMDGFSVLEKMRDEQDCFICVISGLPEEKLAQAKAVRADEALTKPFDSAKLMQIAEKCFKIKAV